MNSNKLLHIIYKNKIYYLLLFPLYTIFLVFLIVPSIEGLIYSLFNFDSSWQIIGFAGLKNYSQLFSEQVFKTALKNTLLMALIVVPCALFMGLLISVGIFRTKKGVRAYVRGSFYLPLVISNVSLSLFWVFIFSATKKGPANMLLSALGASTVNWLGDPRWAFFVVMFVMFTFMLGNPIIMFLASLGSIPESYYEASIVDGANSFHQFFKITLPLLKPTILYLFVTESIRALNVFVLIKIMTSGGPADSTQTLGYMLYTKAFVYNQIGPAMAVGTILSLLSLIFIIIQYKMFASDVEY